MASYEWYKQISMAITAGLLGVAVLAALAAWFARDIARRAETVVQARHALTVRSAAENQLEILRLERARAGEDKIFLESLLPMPDALITVPREVGNVARAHDLEFGFTFGAAKESTTSTPGSLVYTINGKGSAEKWIDFIREFERGTRIVSVEDARLSSGDGSVYSGILHGKIFSQ